MSAIVENYLEGQRKSYSESQYTNNGISSYNLKTRYEQKKKMELHKIDLWCSPLPVCFGNHQIEEIVRMEYIW